MTVVNLYLISLNILIVRNKGPASRPDKKRKKAISKTMRSKNLVAEILPAKSES
jgi:hypothetical protein